MASARVQVGATQEGLGRASVAGWDPQCSIARPDPGFGQERGDGNPFVWRSRGIWNCRAVDRDELHGALTGA